MNNLLHDPGPAPGGEERFETLLRGSGAVLVERIVSHGNVTPEGSWYDQHEDEWVLVLEGEASVEMEGGEQMTLKRGDALFLKRGMRHRVTYTSSPCIWLALHGELELEEKGGPSAPVLR